MSQAGDETTTWKVDYHEDINNFSIQEYAEVVELLTEGEVGVRKIARATGMCPCDSTEVPAMLAYLTTFDKVEQTKYGWVLHKVQGDAEYGRFQQGFLKPVETIFSLLSPTPKSIEQILSHTGLSMDTVELYLQVLMKIIRLGVISRRSRMFQKTWYVESQ